MARVMPQGEIHDGQWFAGALFNILARFLSLAEVLKASEARCVTDHADAAVSFLPDQSSNIELRLERHDFSSKRHLVVDLCQDTK